MAIIQLTDEMVPEFLSTRKELTSGEIETKSSRKNRSKRIFPRSASSRAV